MIDLFSRIWVFLLSLFFASFKPNTLKTQLDLAVVRIRQTRTKLESSVSQQKDIAHTLINSNDPKSKIKVQSMLQDENTASALEYILSTCERLKSSVDLIVDSQNCPPDIKGDVHTVVYASSRVDVPELNNVKDQIALKFGQKFVERALNDRDLVVDRRVIAKLKPITSSDSNVEKYIETKKNK
ncbi:hypothetical protein AKO1_003747 [Acrasis kona]|uniref:Uncharacterized protein n=1 Tax=Acrasis kona TaxID=1008807 RepID=A0AAW2Z6I8_9EUKA